jgi:hypothetical protein
VAKYVLLQFDDDKDADAFVGETQQEGLLVGTRWPRVLVRAVYKKPTQFCKCTSEKPGYSRGKKFGWWVHAACGKPREAWARGDHWYDALGNNLLPLSDEAPEYRGSETYQEWLKKSQEIAIRKMEENSGEQ